MTSISVSLDPAQGHEQQGTRPVLLVSPDRFNTFTHVPIVVPITSGGSFARDAGFTVSLRGRDANQGDPLRPAATFDWPRARAKTRSVPQHILDDVLAKLITLFT